MSQTYLMGSRLYDKIGRQTVGDQNLLHEPLGKMRLYNLRGTAFVDKEV